MGPGADVCGSWGFGPASLRWPSSPPTRWPWLERLGCLGVLGVRALKSLQELHLCQMFCPCCHQIDASCCHVELVIRSRAVPVFLVPPFLYRRKSQASSASL